MTLATITVSAKTPVTPSNVLPIITIACVVALVIFLWFRFGRKRTRFEQVCDTIRQYRPPKTGIITAGIGFHTALYEYLRSKYGEKVKFAPHMQSGIKPDIVIDDIAIEVKGPTGANELDNLISKCANWSDDYKKIIFVLFAPSYRQQTLEQKKSIIKKRFPEIKTVFIPK